MGIGLYVPPALHATSWLFMPLSNENMKIYEKIWKYMMRLQKEKLHKYDKISLRVIK